MTNTKTTTTTTTTSKLSTILNDSKKASVVSCRTLHTKSGDPKYYNYKVSILADNKEDQDAQDILQESRLSILENEENEDRFILACKAINKYVYAQNKQQSNRTKHTTLYNTLQRIKKAIADPAYYNNMGERAKNTIINTMIEYDIDFSLDKENMMKIEAIEAEEKTKAEKIPSNILYIDDPNTSDIINVNNEINNLINKISNNDIINNITALLTPTQKKILKYIAYGYANITISDKLNLHKSTITRHIQAIQKKAIALYPEQQHEKIEIEKDIPYKNYYIDYSIKDKIENLKNNNLIFTQKNTIQKNTKNHESTLNYKKDKRYIELMNK